MSKSNKANKFRTAPSRQPSQSDLQRVFDAFDADSLIHLCSTWDFEQYATKTSLPGHDRFYWYQDNGSNVLAVAHLDSVQDQFPAQVVDTAAGPLVVSGSLDDRLGVYVILELLPKLGITCDWLLTTDEEIARSTATEFAEDFDGKDYDWIIQFDRGGTDVVMYQYETPEYVGLVEDSGAKVGIGSYSDICELDDLGCAAFNWGVGYQDYHSPRAHAWLADTFKMVARFAKFYDANVGTYLPHDPKHQYDDDRGDLDWLLYDAEDSIEADCGHLIDLNDAATYQEWGAGEYVICTNCDVNTYT